MNTKKQSITNDGTYLIQNAELVTGNERIDFYPTYFPNHFLGVEQMLYTYMDRLVKEYDGGIWNFYHGRDNLDGSFPLVVWDSVEPVTIYSEGFQESYKTNPTLASLTVWTIIINHLAWNAKEQEDMRKYSQMYSRITRYMYDQFDDDTENARDSDAVIYHNVLD